MKTIVKFYPNKYFKTSKIINYTVVCHDLCAADMAYFNAGWENDIYCCFAHRVAKDCGIKIQYELEEKREDFQCSLEELIDSDPGGKSNG